MKKLVYLLIGILFVTACSTDDDNGGTTGTLCTDEIVFGLRVTVTDANTSAPLSGVTVQAVDGGYSEFLEEDTNNPGVYLGAAERTGTYLLAFSRTGYQSTAITNGIMVDEDECHVITESVSQAMVPE